MEPKLDRKTLMKGPGNELCDRRRDEDVKLGRVSPGTCSARPMARRRRETKASTRVLDDFAYSGAAVDVGISKGAMAFTLLKNRLGVL